ncbi:energy transducer TonB [Microcystis aeruginosa]|uniref:energy transducer TonB n=1 Tax=Microcystis aeruginosa TaxID=1126 RepID=UPI00232C3F16|nr:energy transducer TonB [Microcystis aeruginosa]MDB9433813.1 energy transducer TonB [Microcystis aeruginosa CS-552/01]
MTSSYFGLETEENKLINSNNLSFAASLGIHGLILAIILPNFLNNPVQEPKKELRNVNLIELNPLEQSRLPSLDSSLSSLPGLPNLNSSSSSLPPLPPMDGIHNSTLPPLPSVSSLPPLPSLPALPPLSSLPSVNIYSPPVASIPSSGRLLIPRNFPTSTPNLPDPPAVTTGQGNDNLPRETNNQQLQPYFDPYQDNLTLDRLRNSPRSASQQAQEQLNNSLARTPEPNGQSPIDEQRRQQLMWEMRERLRSLEADKSNTSNEEAMRNQVDWLARVQKTNPNALNELNQPNQGSGGITTVNLTGNYPATACSRQLAGTAVYGVTVDAQGRLSSEPQLIKSAGFPIFNQQGAREVRSTRFNNHTGESRIYQVRVSFAPNPEVCRGAIANPPKPEGSNLNTRNSPPVTPAIGSPLRPNQTPQPAVSPQLDNVKPPATTGPNPVQTQPESPKEAIIEEKAPETPPQTPALNQPEVSPASPPTSQNPQPLGEEALPPGPPAESKTEPES